MFRRLLTCLALITGLAAVGAPANAAVFDTLSEQVSGTSADCQQGKVTQCDCVVHPATSPTKDDPIKVCKVRKPIVIFIPTIHFGADRAYE
ncbi:hypothetical protein [Allopontixanthobacter sp.]|uniref:hypothetical protein n=1 Tax=Allopontixanthobacter sp. TaxID=2906452 RepID=UPI002ABA8B0C|nr:hypothetical protein [Allopontixanthobacter sp.]MDZ4306968.1 hypothetical protein [Allopontixanthobacter sp.]